MNRPVIPKPWSKDQGVGMLSPHMVRKAKRSGRRRGRSSTPKTNADLKALRALGEAVRALREAQDISQEELAWRAELDRTYVSALEHGRRNCTFVSMNRIVQALRVADSSITLEKIMRLAKL